MDITIITQLTKATISQKNKTPITYSRATVSLHTNIETTHQKREQKYFILEQQQKHICALFDTDFFPGEATEFFAARNSWWLWAGEGVSVCLM